ncbi:MAG: biotin/lipoyl-binding protein [Bacteroidales bacterium]|nr:biotin/lipoyl-binding protein [Bacteroidales bacterium]
MKTYSFKINGKDYKVAIGEANGKMLSVNVNGADYEVELDQAPAAAAGDNSAGAFARTGLRSNAEAEVSPAAEKPAAEKPAAGAGKTVKSPLPGIIISIDVKEGQAVKRGQKVAVIEAMKMENDILAESDGTVTAIHASKGDSVLEGADIVTIG